MRVAVYTVVRDRLPMTRKSFKALRSWAGMRFDHYVADNGSDPETIDYLRQAHEKGHIHTLHLHNENLGQNLAANRLLDKMEDYDWIVRWDNDAMPRTRRFLKKLIDWQELFMENGVFAVVSPTITKLKHPPPARDTFEVDGEQIESVDILGGICRVHPAKLFEDFRFSRFGPLGFGEAQEMAKLSSEAEFPLIRVKDVEVEHLYGEDGQIEKYPDEFQWERREVGRYVSYGI